MNIITEDLAFNKILTSSKTNKIVEGDIIVPDTKPDIIKLLQTDASLVIPKKTISNGYAEIDGRIDLSMIYTPDSENENISGFSSLFEFSEKISDSQINEEDNVFISATVECIDCSIINSRKVHIKATVCIEYEIIRIQPISFATGVDECDNPQIKRETLNFQNSITICEQVFTILEKLELPNGQENISDILKYNIKITDTDYKTLNGKVVLKGVVCVSILYTSPSGNIECNETELQFTQIMDCENILEDCCCDIDFYISDCKLELGEDNDGDQRIINVQIDINVNLKAVEDLEVDMICDCFEPYKKTELIIEKCTIDEIISRPKSQNTIREIVEPSHGLPQISQVYEVIAKPYITSAKISSSKLMCEGHIDTFILYISDNPENPIYTIKKEIPISYMLDAECNCSSPQAQVKPEIKHISYNLNAAGEIELRILFLISANIINQHEIKLISGIKDYDDDKNDFCNITVYFVQNGDTLWSIAKNYCVAVEDIISFNSLKDSLIKVGMRLLIPGK